MGKFKDLTGQTFNDLVVIGRSATKKARYFSCKCVCGVIKDVRMDHLQTNKTTSCGCTGLARRTLASTKHKQSANPLYFVWHSMMIRCYKKTFPDYHNYGGRGILVCAEWQTVEGFIEDMHPGYKKGLQLDRINNDLNYSKQNCKWSTRSENNRNKRTNRFITIGGVTLTAVEWAEKTKIVYNTIIGRYRRGLREYDLISPVIRK